MKNQYLEELYKQMLNRYSIDSQSMKNSEWLVKNTKLKGLPFSFSRYPYQLEVVDDNHPNQYMIKPSQVGASEIYQRKSLLKITRHQNTKAIYAYPDDAMRKKNVQTRVMPLLNMNKVFNLDTDMSEKPVRSIELLQVGNSFMYVTGSKEGDATSTDADFLFIDEYDLHNQAMTALFRSRVLNSDYAEITNFSTPTYTEYGVDKGFNNSDQMFYMIKCDACNHWQFPLFTPAFIHLDGLSSDVANLLELDQGMIDSFNIDVENSYVCCEKCRGPLDLGRQDNRAWVAKYPSRTSSRGRKINPFSVSTRPPSKIIAELLEFKGKDNIKGFKNTILGEAEDSSNNRLSEESIRLLMRGRDVPMPRKDIPCWLGIDMGGTVHITIGLGWEKTAVEVVRLMTCPLNEVLDVVKQIDEDYNLVGGFVDRFPESQTACDIRDLTAGRIMPCEYRGSADLNPVKNAEGDEAIHFQANRTILLDGVKTAINRKHITFRGYELNESILITHLRNMVREESGEQEPTWKKLDSQDHFFHSTGFMLKSMDMPHLLDLRFGIPQSIIMVAGADVGGYNTDIYGRQTSTKKAQPWQTSLQRR